MKLNTNDTLEVFLVRCNGALLEIFTNEPQAVAYMRAKRKNSEFRRIESKRTVPHQL